MGKLKGSNNQIKETYHSRSAKLRQLYRDIRMQLVHQVLKKCCLELQSRYECPSIGFVLLTESAVF